MRPLVLVTFRANDRDKKLIDEVLSGIADVAYLRDLNPYEINKILEDVRIILTGSGRDLTKEILHKARKLEFIQTLSAGADNIPFRLIDDKVLVANNAGGNAVAVAEFALALILSAIKKIPLRDRYMRSGIWLRRLPHALLSNKIVGIIGFGHVGVELAKRLKALGVKVYGVNRSGKSPINIDFIGGLDSLEYVLSKADIVVIALPLTKKTMGFIDSQKLGMMKRNVIIVNVGRGPVINQRDLYEFLKSNPDAIAALDVWWRYPEDYDKRVYQDYPFHELDNVIMTPHIAGFSLDIRDFVIKHALQNIIRYIKGEKPVNIVDRSDYV